MFAACQIRFIQTALLFFLLFNLFSIRLCLSVTIVAMTSNSTSSNPDVPYYNWTNTSIILSSFYWSYALLQFVAGKLVNVFGVKRLLLSTMVVNALTCCLVPITVKYLGGNGLIAIRVLQGLFQGFILPCISASLGRWIPPQELSTMNSMIYSGVYLGAIFSTVVSGYLSASWYGWPSTYYLLGAIGAVWCIFWCVLSAETPAQHKYISTKERQYIEDALGQQDDHLLQTITVPWGAIFKSLPYWAIIVASIGESWVTTLLSSELPSYLSYAVGLNIKDSSLYTAVPLVSALLGTIISGLIAGQCIKRNACTNVNIRRWSQGIGLFSISFGLLLLSYIEDKTLIAAILISTQGLSAAGVCGHIVNPVDLTPRYAGVLTGMSNGLGQLVATLAPILVHFIVTDQTDKVMWRTTLILTSAIGVSTAVFFIIFCSGTRQWWDGVDAKNVKKTDIEL